MDTKGLESDLYAAFLHAATQMGARVSGMSCFARNWGAGALRHDFEPIPRTFRISQQP